MLKNSNLTPYTDQDYAGDFNLLYNHRHCICLALIESHGHLPSAAKLLNMNYDNFLKYIFLHNLYDFIDEIKQEKLGVILPNTLRQKIVNQYGYPKHPTTPYARYNKLMSMLKAKT